jgi:hypothetical protein
MTPSDEFLIMVLFWGIPLIIGSVIWALKK